MRKLGYVAFVMMIFILLPSGNVTGTTANVIEHITVAQQTEYLPRIYDTNIAPAIYSKVNFTSYTDFLQRFTENGSRYIMTYTDISGSANEVSRNWLVQELTTQSNRRLNISIQGTFMNIVATLPGFLPDDDNDLPIFIISAHYDTNDGSPGANRGGSGVAVILELVRIFSQYEWPLDIQFIIFNGEHALGGSLGSEELSNQYALNEVDILAMYNVDTIMRQNRWAPFSERVILGYNIGAQYWANLAKTMGNYYGGDIIRVLPSNQFAQWSFSSHYPFAQKGIQNVLFAFESGYEYDYVSGTEYDVWYRAEYTPYIGREVTAFIGASLAFTMGRGYGHKTQLSDDRTINGGSSVDFYIPVSTPTTINVTCRWFGGGANFLLSDPDSVLINSVLSTSGSPWEPTPVMNHAVTATGLYRMTVYNPGSDSIGVEIDIEYQSDVDENGILDHNEYWLDNALFQSDADGDTITDALEIIYGTDVNSPDSDNDLMDDAYELEIGFNPRDSQDALGDADNDNLTNLQEYNRGLNPFSADSDEDGMSDYWEISNGLNPLVNDADDNPDEDMYTNYEEYLRGSDPNEAEVVETIPLPLLIGVPSAAVILLGVAVYLVRRE